jgi:hypothetical protein
MTPPRLARRLLQRLAPSHVRDVLVGDLDEEYERLIAPGRSRAAARWWYWRQVCRSAPSLWRLNRRVHRQREARPSWRR